MLYFEVSRDYIGNDFVLLRPYIKKYYLVTKTNKTRFTSFEELDKLVTSINIAEQEFVVKLEELSSLSTEITDEIIQKWNNNHV